MRPTSGVLPSYAYLYGYLYGPGSMRRLLPRFHEMVLFALAAIIAALVVVQVHPDSHDLAIASAAFPLFLMAALMGLRRSPAWSVRDDGDEE